MTKNKWSSLKRKLKGRLKRIRITYAEVFHGYTKQELESFLRGMGLQMGDVVMVHSSFDSFVGFRGQPADIIQSLQSIIGETGAILMPTMPFLGTAIDYVRQNGILDIRRTPSQMGMISEIFRRLPRVIRSVHPTHPVAAWGAQVHDLIHAHYLSKTPCGRETPFGRLVDFKGKILLLGTGIEAMTFFHSMEEQLEPVMPFSPFTKEEFMLQTRDERGQLVQTATRLFDPVVSRRRNVNKLGPVLREMGYWNEGRLGGLDSILLKAADVAEACKSMAQQNRFCYDA